VSQIIEYDIMIRMLAQDIFIFIINYSGTSITLTSRSRILDNSNECLAPCISTKCTQVGTQHFFYNSNFCFVPDRFELVIEVSLYINTYLPTAPTFYRI